MQLHVKKRLQLPLPIPLKLVYDYNYIYIYNYHYRYNYHYLSWENVLADKVYILSCTLTYNQQQIFLTWMSFTSLIPIKPGRESMEACPNPNEPR